MPRRTSVAGALCLTLAAVAAACGGGEGADGVATLQETAATTAVAGVDEFAGADMEEALLAFAACMREEGIDLPDPELDAAGNLKLVSFMADAGSAVAAAGGPEALRDAATACRHHLTGVALRFASIDRTEMEDRLLAYAGCMREHGYDLPDPDFSGAGPGMRGPFPGLGLAALGDPAFVEANEACERVFAGLVPGAGEPAEGG